MNKSYLVLAVAMAMALVLPASAQGPGDWTEYAGNPIFGQGVGSGPKAYYPSVLYDADSFSGHGTSAKYKMWYGTSSQQTGLATSDDGLAWTDQGVVMTDGYHATVEYYADGFAGANSGDNPSDGTMYYRMWYWDWPTIYSVTAIGYAESPDGSNWYNLQPVQNGTIPIVTGVHPEWNRGSYGPCDVLYSPGASNMGTDWTFTMYYDGSAGGDEKIGVAFSSNGISWVGYDSGSDGKADPVFEGTYVAGSWDRTYVSRATIIKNAADDYQMWYSGGDGKMDHGIGYATSNDGIHWTRDAANPIFHKDDGVAWRDVRTYCPAVLKDGSGYSMWYAGNDGSNYAIGYATAAPPNEPPDCSGAYAAPDTLWPANHKFVAVGVMGVTDPDGDPVTITFDTIFQDEPVDGTGDGSFVPDGLIGENGSTAEVRAERDGGGNGRVYAIGFTADDGNGGSCEGTVAVGVPKSKKKAVVDDGTVYNSTQP